MKTKFFTFLLAILTSLSVRTLADGPPISADGILLEDGPRFALSATQKSELLFSRCITLTDQQALHSGLRFHDRRLFVLTANFNDCTCGMTYGIWFHPDSVAVFGQEYSSYDTMINGALLPARGLRNVIENKSDEMLKRSLYISAEGNLYFEGNKIEATQDAYDATFEKLAANMELLNAPVNEQNETANESDLQTVIVFIPPILGNRHKPSVLETFYRLIMMKARNSLPDFFFQ